jgi:hypothetical protein
MSFEKLFVSLISHYGEMAKHHMPLALYKYATEFDKDLPVEFKRTAQLMTKFESICSLDGFGYKTPPDEELREMILGLSAVNKYVADKIA